VTLPNFLVIGAGRSGTTSLQHYLAQHSAVFLPDKAPSHFYCCDGLPPIDDPLLRAQTRAFVADPVAYERLFDGARGETAIGEVSPVYLATTAAAPRIAARLPNVKLIAILRHPVDRAWARYVARVRDGLERRTDFRDIVRAETAASLPRDDGFGTYIASGFVHHYLSSYHQRFPPERMRIYLFDDLVRDPVALMADLFRFLGVDDRIRLDTAARHNKSGGFIRNPTVRAAWTGSARLRTALRPYLPARVRDAGFRAVTGDLVAPSLHPALRAELVDLFRDDTLRLQDLIGRDLSHWLANEPVPAAR